MIIREYGRDKSFDSGFKVLHFVVYFFKFKFSDSGFKKVKIFKFSSYTYRFANAKH